MNYKMFEEVTLLEDVREKGLRKGDVATIVEHHPVPNAEDGYSLEVFNVLGEYNCRYNSTRIGDSSID